MATHEQAHRVLIDSGMAVLIRTTSIVGYENYLFADPATGMVAR